MLENLATIGLAGFGALTVLAAFSLGFWLVLWIVTAPFSHDFLDRYGQPTKEILARGRQNGIDGRRRNARLSLRKVLKLSPEE